MGVFEAIRPNATPSRARAHPAGFSRVIVIINVKVLIRHGALVGVEQCAMSRSGPMGLAASQGCGRVVRLIFLRTKSCVDQGSRSMLDVIVYIDYQTTSHQSIEFWYTINQSMLFLYNIAQSIEFRYTINQSIEFRYAITQSMSFRYSIAQSMTASIASNIDISARNR